ncbi:MAG: hypothetical protein KKC46_02985 [Proteobacteria bacterium]|nr:hypothetical protein [Pseudomonadota bacterium]
MMYEDKYLFFRHETALLKFRRKRCQARHETGKELVHAGKNYFKKLYLITIGIIAGAGF